MKMQSRFVLAVGVVVAANSLTQAQYIRLAAFNPTIQAGQASPTFVGFTLDSTGSTIYGLVGGSISGTPSHRVTLVSGVNGVTTPAPGSTLLPTTGPNSFATVSANAQPSGRIYDGGSFLQISDNTTNQRQVVRVDKSTSVPSVYLSPTTITGFTGSANSTLFASAISPDGEAVIYDSITKQIYASSGANSVVSVLSASALSAGTGLASGSVVPGPNLSLSGLSVASNGDVFFGDIAGGARAIYRYTPSTNTLSQIVTTAQMGSLSILNTAFFAAPDGNLYFNNGGTGGIFSVPQATGGTPVAVLSNAQLVGGPAASAAVSSFNWWNGQLSWNVGAGPNAGVYAIPEPAALMAGLMAATVLLARRNK